MIIDGQWGSTGKGKLAGWVYYNLPLDEPIFAVCDFMPNAGHTVYHPEGHAVVTRQLPTGAAFLDVQCLIGPHAAIDVDGLMGEIKAIEALNIEGPGIRDRLFIHPRAAVVQPGHRESEKSMTRISSTMKGGHAASVDKIMRRDGETEGTTWVQVWRVAEVGFVCLPGEVFVEWGLKIKAESPFPWTFPIELSNDYLGYMVTPQAWEAGGYESLIARSAKPSVEGVKMMVDRSLALLHRL